VNSVRRVQYNKFERKEPPLMPLLSSFFFVRLFFLFFFLLKCVFAVETRESAPSKVGKEKGKRGEREKEFRNNGGAPLGLFRCVHMRGQLKAF